MDIMGPLSPHLGRGGAHINTGVFKSGIQFENLVGWGLKAKVSFICSENESLNIYPNDTKEII